MQEKIPGYCKAFPTYARACVYSSIAAADSRIRENRRSFTSAC